MELMYGSGSSRISPFNEHEIIERAIPLLNQGSMFQYIALVLVILVVVSKSLSGVLPRFFLVPPYDWKEKITKVINYPKPIYLSVGHKKSSYRRRLILSSLQPSFYTNYVNNKIKINQLDAKNESFVPSMNNRGIDDPNRKKIFGFFHPYANNGGGGERVLWQAVKSTLLQSSNNIVVIYTTNQVEPLSILKKVEDKFEIKNLDSSKIVFIYLTRFSNLIDGNYWKHFTLIGQLLGSALLALEALYHLSPDVWIDTIGLPGSYLPVNYILKCPILAYVHYPIIQPDMFNKLKFKSFQNLITGFKFNSSNFKHGFKFIYWSLIYYLYIYLGSLVDITLANGSWTHAHLQNIWCLNPHESIQILYPPCGTESLTSTSEVARQNKFIYIAQFRPEKRHDLILAEFKKFLQASTKSNIPINKTPSLIFLGSCRTEDDTSTLESLKKEVAELNLSDYVEFVVDCSYDTILELLSSVKFGLNAMWNEHFGIGVVEYLSRGVIPVVHASAGPLLDIVLNDQVSSSWYNDLGFFFKSASDPDFDPSLNSDDPNSLKFKFNDKIIEYPSLSQLLSTFYIENPDLILESNLQLMRSKGSKLMVERFSNKVFSSNWMEYMDNLAVLEKQHRELRGDVEKVH